MISTTYDYNKNLRALYGQSRTELNYAENMMNQYVTYSKIEKQNTNIIESIKSFYINVSQYDYLLPKSEIDYKPFILKSEYDRMYTSNKNEYICMKLLDKMKNKSYKTSFDYYDTYYLFFQIDDCDYRIEVPRFFKKNDEQGKRNFCILEEEYKYYQNNNLIIDDIEWIRHDYSEELRLIDN